MAAEMIHGEGRSGRPENGNAASPSDGRQGGDDREHQRFGPLRQGLLNEIDRRMAATGAGQSDLPIDAYSADAHDAVHRIETILAGNAS
jgi:hypothetical protein